MKRYIGDINGYLTPSHSSDIVYQLGCIEIGEFDNGNLKILISFKDKEKINNFLSQCLKVISSSFQWIENDLKSKNIDKENIKEVEDFLTISYKDVKREYLDYDFAKKIEKMLKNQKEVEILINF